MDLNLRQQQNSHAKDAFLAAMRTEQLGESCCCGRTKSEAHKSLVEGVLQRREGGGKKLWYRGEKGLRGK